MDGVKVALGSRGMTVEAVRQLQEGVESTVHMQMIEFHAAIFAWYPVFFPTALSRTGGLSPGEGWDAAV